MLLRVRLIWRLRQRGLPGALRVRRCSWIGQRRFERFVCVGSRVLDHDMTPGKWVEGAEAAITAMPSLAATTYSHDLILSIEMVRLADVAAMFKIAQFEEQFSYALGPQQESSGSLASRPELAILIQRRI